MRVCKVVVRALAGLVIAGGMWGASANAQSLTVSPTDLSFGVPTGTSPAVSAPQTITVNIQGSGPVTFSNTGSASTGNSDFAVNGNSCKGTLTAPTTCQVSVVFTASQAPAGTLETATLTITSSLPEASLSVPMNGAYGAIEIFGALNINPSLFSGQTWPQTFGKPVSTNTIALSCPATLPAIVAKLSSTPDGNGKVFQDNTLQVVTPSADPTKTLNVCRGGDSSFGGFTGFPANTTNCFQQPFEGAAGGYLGQNPDLAGFPNHQGAPGTFIAQYGVPVIDVSSFLTTGTQKVTVELDDAGGDLGAATLHLVTNCSLAGTVPGGSITGNPVNANDPASQTQTFIFDNGGGQNIGFTTSSSTAQQQGTVTIPDGTVPIVTDIGIPQQLFSQLVAGKPSAPAVCLRLTGEVDVLNQPMCKGYLIQCQDPTTGTVSGDNCVPNPSTARNLLDIARFESPDAPSNGTNYLGTACNFATGVNCAPTNLTASTPVLIGPGMLLGSDNWLCVINPSSSGCSTNQPNTGTAASPATYSASNCVLTGKIAGNICPLDTLTEFLGAADPVHGSTTSGKNSIFVPVVNMPLPYTTYTTSSISPYGWAKSASVSVNFVSNAANYTATTPAANGFTQAPVYSFTYGITPSTSPIPDTTYPISTDTTTFNLPGANPNFANPLCASGTSLSFSNMGVGFSGTEGNFYNVHYFTTDCALTEELLFKPTTSQLTDPTANWASFRVLSFGVDTTAPVLTCTQNPSTANGNFGWYKTNVAVSCTGTDNGSGFADTLTPVPNTNGVQQGSTPTTLPTATTAVASGSANANAPIAAQTVADLAGNSASQGPYSFSIDQAPPSITAKYSASGTAFTVGQVVTVKLTCNDVGSGVASCGGQPVACLLAPAVGSPTFTTASLTIDTSAGAVGPHTFNATDCAGNVSGSVSYTVAYGSVELAIANIPNPLTSVKSGNNLTYKIFVLDLSANTASNIVVTDTIPANTQYVSAMSGIVSCSLGGCNDLTTGSSCSVSGTGGPGSVVTCLTPTVKPILPGLTGYVIKLVVKVSAPSSVKSITDTATVTSSNPDTNRNDNTVTVTTKVTQ